MFKHQDKTTDNEFRNQSSQIEDMMAQLRKGKDAKVVFENYSDKKRLILEWKSGILINIKEEDK